MGLLGSARRVALTARYLTSTGSEGGAVCLVPGDPAKDGAWPGKAPAALRAGWNEVLAKITQDPGGWWFTLDFLAADGERDEEAEEHYRKAIELAEPERRATAYSLLANFFYSRE